MNTYRRYHDLFECMVALMLVFSGLHLFAAPRSVLARVVAAGPQMQSHPAPVDRSGGIPFLATRLAAPSAAPIANPDSASTTEDVPIDINVLNNDTGVSLTVTSTNTTGTLANVTINPNDTIHYDPTSGLNYLQSGDIYTDTFQYTISDITGTLATAAVTVTVSGVNDNPIAVDDSVSTNESTPADFSVLANDSDPDTGDTALLTIQSIDTTGTQGVVTINSGNTSVHYNPGTVFDYLGQGQTATDTFGYTVSDGHGGTATATVTITINGVNNNPIAVDDSVSTGENTPANIDVLANDSDPDTSDNLTVQSVDTITYSTQGAVAIASGGASVNYDPGTVFDYLGQGQTATDNFGYTVSDGNGGTATATVTVTINGANNNPIAVDDAVSTGENTATNISVLANDSDPDTGDTALLTIQSIDTTGTQGVVTINSGNTSVNYDPGTAFDYLGQGQTATDTFGYTVSDTHGGTATATVTVTINGVNDSPTAVSDSFSTNEDTALDLNLLSNDTDPDTSDVLTIQSLNTAGTLGAVTINSGGGSVHYDPATAFNNLYVGQVAIDTFGYTINDGHNATSTATVTVTVTGVNDNPIPLDDTASTGENTTINISASTVLSNDTDPDGDPLSVTGVITTGTQGNVSWNASSQYIHYNPGTAFDYLAAGTTGTDTFQYTVCDNHSGCADATVTVTLTGANDNPTPSNDTANTGENTATNIDVLANDTDPDTGDTALLTVQSVDTITNGTKGVVTINSGSKSVHYDPGMAFNYLGRNQTTTDTFGYTVSDGHGGTGTATVTVTLVGANDPPVAVEDIYTTPANTTLNVLAQNGVLSNDSDPDTGDTLSAALVIYPSHSDGTFSLQPSGGFVYTPASNYHGLDHFVYHASDGLLSSNNVTVTIGVDVTNQPPVVVADTKTTPEDTPVTIPVTSNDYDPDGSLNLSTLKVLTGPAHGTTQVNTSTGAITYRPALNFNGTDSFQYQIYDQDAVLPMAGTAPVTVTVTPVNDPPQATDLNKTTLEDTPLSIDLATSVSDVENDIVKSSLQVTTPPSHGTAVAKTDLTITYSPAPNYNGSDQFGYRICDTGSLCAQAKITIDVKPVNDPPVAANDHYYTKPISLTVKAPGVLANDSDVDAGDHLKVSKVVSTPINGELKLNEDGSFTYTPNAKFTSGNDSFTYQVSDSHGALSNIARVTITVDGSPPNVNWQSPMANGGIYYATSGQQIPLVISATDNIPIARVEFFWWDPKKGGTGGFVDIANLTKAPFRALINVNNLNIGWNQIFARAYDAAGNINIVDNPDHPGFVWIIRKENIYLPLMAIGKSR